MSLSVREQEGTAATADLRAAPADHPEIAEFLVREGIDSISVDPDSLMNVTLRVVRTEEALEREKNIEDEEGRRKKRSTPWR